MSLCSAPTTTGGAGRLYDVVTAASSSSNSLPAADRCWPNTRPRATSRAVGPLSARRRRRRRRHIGGRTNGASEPTADEREAGGNRTGTTAAPGRAGPGPQSITKPLHRARGEPSQARPRWGSTANEGHENNGPHASTTLIKTKQLLRRFDW